MSHLKPPQPAHTPRRLHWRRLLQFRLRTILILTTIIAVWLGWWSHKARQQREAVAAISAVGGGIEYDFQLYEPSVTNPSHWPKWLVDVIGVDYFANVEGIYLGGCQVTVATLEQIQCLTALQECELGRTQVGDTDLAHLKGLTKLQYLGLGNTRITDAGLKHLVLLAHLQHLTLKGTKITDAGLEHLGQLGCLETLDLSETHITEEGAARLEALLPECGISRDNLSLGPTSAKHLSIDWRPLGPLTDKPAQ